jgi:hypothetical protein
MVMTTNIIEIMPDDMPNWMQEAMEAGQLAKICIEKNKTKKDYIIEQSNIIRKLRREKTELAKSRFKLNERLLNRITKLEAQLKEEGGLCPHCGYNCHGKSFFCLLPKT